MPELMLLIDKTNGAMLLEDSQLPASVLAEMTALAGEGKECGCARPLEVIPSLMASREEQAMDVCVRIAGYYHNSFMEGPGRRSSVLFQFCPLACKGFIYSLKWAKYDLAHDRTEQQTFFNRPELRNVAQQISC